MAYSNFFSFLGRKWIAPEALEVILKKYPASGYRTFVEFADGSEMSLADCDGSERNVAAIIIAYNDGTTAVDPDPYIHPVSGRIELADLYDGTFGASAHFFVRSKHHELFPHTRNDSIKTLNKYRSMVREKFCNFVHMNGMESPVLHKTDTDDMEIPVNIFRPEDRANLIRFLSTLDTDGVPATLTVHFTRSTVDQLERLDTEMEFGDLGEVLELTENDRGS